MCLLNLGGSCLLGNKLVCHGHFHRPASHGSHTVWYTSADTAWIWSPCGADSANVIICCVRIDCACAYLCCAKPSLQKCTSGLYPLRDQMEHNWSTVWFFLTNRWPLMCPCASDSCAGRVSNMVNIFMTKQKMVFLLREHSRAAKKSSCFMAIVRWMKHPTETRHDLACIWMTDVMLIMMVTDYYLCVTVNEWAVNQEHK